jgi:hypothetical protein
MVAPSRGTSFMVVGIHHGDAVLGGIAHALARLELARLSRQRESHSSCHEQIVAGP